MGTPINNDDLATKTLKRMASLEGERRSWEPHWSDIAEHFMPRRGRFWANVSETNRGEEVNFLETGEGIKALDNLAAVMQSGITTPSRPWFALSLESTELTHHGGVRAWLHKVQEILSNLFQSTNFYNEIHTLYKELGAFGVGAVFVADDDDNKVRFRTMTAGEYYLANSAAGLVDTCYRRLSFTARQIVEMWPETVPDEIERQAENKNETWLEVIHAIEPNPDYKEGSVEDKKRKYLSLYLLPDKKILEHSGFYEFPVLAPRWETTGADVYGSSPCMNALPDCRQLQSLTETGRVGIEKEVNPALAAYGLDDDDLDVSPGAVVHFNGQMQGQAGIQPLYNVKANFAALSVEKEALKKSIREMLFNDLLLLISSHSRAMTATQAEIMDNEKLLLLGPVLDKLRSELFNPLVARVYGIMERKGLLPPPPKELDGQTMKIEFLSILAVAQKQAAKSGITEIVGFVGQVAQATNNPAALDKLDVDAVIDKIAEISGVPPEIIRSAEAVAELRAKRAQEEAQAKQMAMLERGVGIAAGGAGAAKDALGSLPPEVLQMAGQMMGGQTPQSPQGPDGASGQGE